MVIKNQKLKELALMRIAGDSKDSRNLLMLSQNVSLHFIKNQPESFLGKRLTASSPDNMDDRINLKIRNAKEACMRSIIIDIMNILEINMQK